VLWGSFYGCALGSSCTVISSLFPFSIKLLITYKKKKNVNCTFKLPSTSLSRILTLGLISMPQSPQYSNPFQSLITEEETRIQVP
jgi:hypothetical protein